MKIISFVLLFSIFILMQGCNLKNSSENSNISINKHLTYYLDSIQVDSFSYEWEVYPGVINLFARNVNDSNFILLLPGQCFFKTPDYYGSFVYKNKYFVCQGDSMLIKSLIDLNKIQLDTTLQWKYCDDVGIDIYDPKHITLYIKSEDLIEVVNLPSDKNSEIMVGEKPPLPIPINYDDFNIDEEE